MEYKVAIKVLRSRTDDPEVETKMQRVIISFLLLTLISVLTYTLLCPETPS